MSESDADLLRTLDEVTDPRESPVATPGDVADELPIGAEAVRQRLIRLAADDDGIMTRKVGRSRVFWTWTAVGDDVDDDRERADHGGGPTDFDPNADVDELLQEESDDDLRSEVLEQLEDSDVQARSAREGLATVAVLLDENGIMKTGELRAETYDRHSDDYNGEKGMWASIHPFIDDFEYIEDPGRGEWAPSRPRNSLSG